MRLPVPSKPSDSRKNYARDLRRYEKDVEVILTELKPIVSRTMSAIAEHLQKDTKGYALPLKVS
jgi:hypothetical protein